MRTLASVVPPGPVAVIVYVVDAVKVTFVEPSGATLPTPGDKFNSVAFVDDQFRLTASPDLTNVEDALSVTVGRAGAGAGAGTGGGGAGAGFLAQAPAKKISVNKLHNRAMFRTNRLCI